MALRTRSPRLGTGLGHLASRGLACERRGQPESSQAPLQRSRERARLEQCAYPVGSGRIANRLSVRILVVRCRAGAQQQPDDLSLLLDRVRASTVAAAGILDGEVERCGAVAVPAAWR